jgi:hypothetical protein
VLWYSAAPRKQVGASLVILAIAAFCEAEGRERWTACFAQYQRSYQESGIEEDIMDRVGRVAAIFVGVSVSAACSGPDEYRPLAEGEAVRIHVSGYNLPFADDGAEYRGDADAYIENPNSDNEFGVRADDGDYLPDTFVMNNGLEEKTLPCILWQDNKPNDFVAAWCRTSFVQAEPGRTVRVRFNDFNDSVVVMPELTELTSPKENSEFSIRRVQHQLRRGSGAVMGAAAQGGFRGVVACAARCRRARFLRRQDILEFFGRVDGRHRLVRHSQG